MEEFRQGNNEAAQEVVIDPKLICQEGLVERVEGGAAYVRVEAPEGCEGCGSKHVCGALSNEGKLLQVRNRVGAEVGQRVELTVEPSAVVTASFLLFIVPLLTCLAGIVSGYALADAMGWPGKQWIGLAIGLSAFFLTYVVIRLLTPLFERSGRFEPVIRRIIV
jgi:positive regulator of sigma E activity